MYEETLVILKPDALERRLIGSIIQRYEEAGLKVVMNRCPKIEFGRLSGEIGWAGVHTRTLSSQKPVMGARGVQNFTLAKR